jgi:acetyltransferase-like isoleucine patch superfamily enzyme
VFIGKNTRTGQYFSAHLENHIFTNSKSLIRHQGVARTGIMIGENCWVGSKVTILDGVTIGNNCVIAAAVVTGSFLDDILIGGVPAVTL